MKFGLQMVAQDPPDGENIVRRWEEVLEEAEVAEEAGFDGVFLPEHHSMPDGYMCSPWAALGAIAARTSTIEIGTALTLLPFQHPVSVAEAVAMADVISNGRIRLGCGLGNFEPEFDLFGLEKKDQVSRIEESLDIIQRLWAGEEIDHHGRHFDVKGKLSPLPVNATIQLGAMSEPGVRRAARFGIPWLADPLHNLDVISYWRDVYRAEGAEQGTTHKLEIDLLRCGWVGDDLDEVDRVWWPNARAEQWFYFSRVPRWVLDREPLLQGVEREEDFKFESHRQDRFIAGSPQDCIEAIRRFRDEIEPEYMILALRLATGPEHDRQLECIRRFGSEVFPVIREEEAGATASGAVAGT